MAFKQRRIGFHHQLRHIDAGVVHEPGEWPALFSSSDSALPIRLLGHIKLEELRRGAKFTRQGLAFGFQHITKNNARTFRDQKPRLCCALPARAA